MVRRIFCCLLLFLAGRGQGAERPNILVVIADQWRAQAFGFAGDPNVKTPAFDQFAKESVRFTNAVSGLPVCSPMRASFLTGQRPLTHGVFINDVPLSPGATTIAKVLRGEGYATGMIGKWHVDGHGRSAFIPPSRRLGFEYWKAQECTHAYNNSRYYADSPEPQKWPDYDATSQTADAQEFIRARAREKKPFALMLAWGPPHDPYHTAPAEYRAMYDPADLKLRPNVPPEAEESARKNLAGYYAHCTALDDNFAKLLSTLDEAGVTTNTIVMFTSDHGDMLGSHGLVKKQKPYDESIRVPMLIRYPARLTPRDLDAPINSEDIMPTLLGLAGVAIPKTVEGIDYTEYARGGKNPGDGVTVTHCPSPFGEWERRRGGREYRGIRTTRYTYVRDLNGPWLLFDNRADPYQTNNLVDVPAQAELRREMEAALARKLKEREDEFLPGGDYIRKWGYKVDANGTMPFTN